MGTEYRRGIPSVAHIEAATRLGLEWEQAGRRWRFAIRNGEVWFGWDSGLSRLDNNGIVTRDFLEDRSYRPIRADGTLVDWAVLDAEVVRAQGPIVGTVLYALFGDRVEDRGEVTEFLTQRQPGLPMLNGQPLPLISFQQTLDTVNSAITRVVLGKVEAPVKPEPLPRFTADELDDVDHSQSTKLDSSPLKRGKLPTAEQIGKYREVMAKRNGTVDEARKASGIDCEVAQYVLERWACGLSDKEAQKLIADRYSENMNQYPRSYLDRVLGEVLARPLDPATDDSARRQREEREVQRQRMAALQAQLAAERAARTVEPQPEPSRFDLLECDPKANPAASIAAWETRQKRSIVRQMPKPQPQPQPAPHRLFDVVDAEAGGLRPGAVFTALLGRALNPNC